MLTVLTGAEAKKRVGQLHRRMSGWPAEISARVDSILAEIRARGDDAVLEFTQKFDGVSLDKRQLRVSAAEIEAAHRDVDLAFLKAFETAYENVDRYHRHQSERS